MVRHSESESDTLAVMIPTDSEILSLLDELSTKTADDLETQFLDFKPWTDAKADMKVAVEYAVCFANAKGGVVVFGVADRMRGRAMAIHGVTGCDLDVWKRGIWDSTQPHIEAEVHELVVPEGTGRLLVVRIPKGTEPPHGTTKGYFSQRVGKNCMPLDAASFARSRISSGALDWSGAETALMFRDLDPVEVARGKNILRGLRPESDLLKLSDEAFVQAVRGISNGRVTHAGLLLFGRVDMVRKICPQHQVHYVLQTSEVDVARNDSYQDGLLAVLGRIEQHFSGPMNPEYELEVGLSAARRSRGRAECGDAPRLQRSARSAHPTHQAGACRDKPRRLHRRHHAAEHSPPRASEPEPDSCGGF